MHKNKKVLPRFPINTIPIKPRNEYGLKTRLQKHPSIPICSSMRTEQNRHQKTIQRFSPK